MIAGHAKEDPLNATIRRSADFAATHIASRPGLSGDRDFPWDLWRGMGAAGLLGIGIPGEYGGSGLGYPGISGAGKALARHGLCLGITLSWLMHQITARFLLCSFASDDLKRTYLPALARGAVTFSIAISEPGVGGHPKHLKTSAERDGEGYVLHGEKTYLTNGPMADFFVVLAVSGQDGERKRYSAFLVPKGCAGLTITGPMDVGFLRPCMHGGIVLHGCRVPEGNLMGSPGSAYEDMAMPFRDVEDTAMMGPVLGAQEARFGGLAAALRERGGPVSEETSFRLGGVGCSLVALDVLAREAACSLESGGTGGSLQDLVLSFRNLYGQVHAEVEALRVLEEVPAQEAYRSLTHDLDHIVRFAGRVGRIRQIKVGAGLVSAGAGKDVR